MDIFPRAGSAAPALTVPLAMGTRHRSRRLGRVPFMGPAPSCLIPRFDGAIFSWEWMEALWDRFVTGAPRTFTRQWFAQQTMRGHVRRQSSNTAIASFARAAEPGARHQSEDGGEVAERATVEDMKTGPTEPRSTVLTEGECPTFCVSVIWSMLPERSKDDDDFERVAGRTAEGLQAA